MTLIDLCCIRAVVRKLLDVHLMVEHPNDTIDLERFQKEIEEKRRAEQQEGLG